MFVFDNWVISGALPGDNTAAQVFIDRIDALLVSAGWTLHDNLGAGSGESFGKVMYNGGGEELLVPYYLHMWVEPDGPKNQISIRGWWDWNATTHVGTNGSPQGVTLHSILTQDDSNPCPYAISITKDGFAVAVLVKDAGPEPRSLHFAAFEIPFPYLAVNPDRTLQIEPLVSGISAGSNVVIPLANTSYFEATGKYFIRQGATFDKFTVISIDPGVSITADLLANSYTSGTPPLGTFVGRNPVPFHLMHTYAVGNEALNGGTGWDAVTGALTLGGSPHPAVQFGDPDSQNGLYHPLQDFHNNIGAFNPGPRAWSRHYRRLGQEFPDQSTINIGAQEWLVINTAVPHIYIRKI